MSELAARAQRRRAGLVKGSQTHFTPVKNCKHFLVKRKSNNKLKRERKKKRKEKSDGINQRKPFRVEEFLFCNKLLLLCFFGSLHCWFPILKRYPRGLPEVVGCLRSMRNLGGSENM